MVFRGRRTIGVVGLALAEAGTILAARGPQGVDASVRWLYSHAGLIIVGAAVVALVHNTVPRGSLPGPVALGIVGFAVLAWQDGWRPATGPWLVIGTGIAALGGWIVTQRDAPAPPPEPVRRVVAAVFNRKVRYQAGQDAPERLSVIALGCRVTVDLASAGLPRLGPVEINVACLLGHVELAVPRHWPVVAGRVNNTRGLRLRALLDSTDTFDDPHSQKQFDELWEMAAARMTAVGAAKTGAPVVLHVLGLGGGVTILDRC